MMTGAGEKSPITSINVMRVNDDFMISGFVDEYASDDGDVRELVTFDCCSGTGRN